MTTLLFVGLKAKKVILTGQKQDRDTADGTIEILLLFKFKFQVMRIITLLGRSLFSQ